MVSSVPSIFVYTKNSYASAVSNASGNLPTFRSMGPLFLKNCTYAPSILTLPSARFSWYSSRRRGVKPQFLETMIFWRPGNLYCERRRASIAVARSVVLLFSNTVLYFARKYTAVGTHEYHGFGRIAEFDQCLLEQRFHWAFPKPHAFRFAAYRRRRMTTSC